MDRYSVPRRAAEKVFPPLDYSQQPPAQELFARDLHDNEWKFRHIFRGDEDFNSRNSLKGGNDMSLIRSMDQGALKGLGGSKTRARAKKAQEVLNQIVSTLMETSPSSSLGVEDKMVTYLIQLEDP